MKWGNSKRDHDLILAVWPRFEPNYDYWQMQELAYREGDAPTWRARRVPTERGYVRSDVYSDEGTAKSTAESLNIELLSQIETIADPVTRQSLRLRAVKSIQAKQRLANEEKLMLAEAKQRASRDPRVSKGDLVLHPSAEIFRESLFQKLQDMPYLSLCQVAPRVHMEHLGGNRWTVVFNGSTKGAEFALRAQIANGFGLSYRDHWGKVKGQIRKILLPRANQLLQLASVKRLLDDALRAGDRMLVCNGVVFWYEPDGDVGWQVKQTSQVESADGEAIWREGTILSTNHGRLVVLPYIKENGEQVKGHTKNGPGDGPAKPRHAKDYVEIPFKSLKDDLMIGLFGELPYE
ncbi:hypothetical protein [Pseudomonas protegens]|uniref:hypothetical protein n=1 Tax=Pseudomonas protegens TaxID=380021 RepID=UPI0024C3C383|nr:hypothetical protein [Pseudomonas protegens]MDK1396559.1 hypothetical protein [Pseudomonas protegens]